MAFPTLSRDPKKVTPKYRRAPEEGLTEDDYSVRRPVVTRKVKEFTVDYDLLSATDKGLLITHYESVETTTSFSWTDNESNTYTVYYKVPVSYYLVVPGWFQFDTIELIEQ